MHKPERSAMRRALPALVLILSGCHRDVTTEAVSTALLFEAQQLALSRAQASPLFCVGTFTPAKHMVGTWPDSSEPTLPTSSDAIADPPENVLIEARRATILGAPRFESVSFCSGWWGTPAQRGGALLLLYRVEKVDNSEASIDVAMLTGVSASRSVIREVWKGGRTGRWDVVGKRVLVLSRAGPHGGLPRFVL